MMIFTFLTAFAQATDELDISFIQYNLAGYEAFHIVEKVRDTGIDFSHLLGSKLDKDMYVITTQETGVGAGNSDFYGLCRSACKYPVYVYDRIKDIFDARSKEEGTKYAKLGHQLNGYIGVIIFVKEALLPKFLDQKGYTLDCYGPGKGNSKGSASITVNYEPSPEESFPLHFTSLHLPSGKSNYEERRKCLRYIVKKSLEVSQANCEKYEEEQQQCLDGTTMAYNGDYNWRLDLSEVPEADKRRFYENQGWDPDTTTWDPEVLKEGKEKATTCIKNQELWLEGMRNFDEGPKGSKDILNIEGSGNEEGYDLVEAIEAKSAQKLHPTYKLVKPKETDAGKMCFKMYRQPALTDRVAFLQRQNGSKVRFTTTDYGTTIAENNNLFGSDHFPVVANVKLQRDEWVYGNADCFERNVAFVVRGNLLERTSAETPLACQNKCMVREGCAAWTWRGKRGRRCILHASRFGRKIDIKSNNGTISGPKGCVPPSTPEPTPSSEGKSSL